MYANITPTKITPNNTILENNCAKLTPKKRQITPQCVDEERLQCNYCLTTFSRKDSLNRHIKHRCKEKLKIENEKEKIYRSLLEKMEIMENKINNLEDENKNLKTQLVCKTVNNTTNNTTNNNNTINNNTINNNNNTYNIQLVAYGQEQLDHLTDRHYKYIINKGFKSIQELVKFVPFIESFSIKLDLIYYLIN